MADLPLSTGSRSGSPLDPEKQMEIPSKFQIGAQGGAPACSRTSSAVASTAPRRKPLNRTKQQAKAGSNSAPILAAGGRHDAPITS